MEGNSRGETPLHYALLSGNEKIVSKLIRYGADVNIVAHDGKPLLALTEDEEIKKLLDRGKASQKNFK